MTFKQRQVVLLVIVFISLLVNSSVALKSISLKQLKEVVVPKTEFVVVVFQADINEQIKELSKRVVEEVDRVSTALTQDGNTRIRFYTIHLDQNPEAISEYNLNDVPAIVIYRDKYPRIYYGQRTGYTLFSFFQELMIIDPIKVIVNKQDKKQFTADEHTIKVVGYIPKEGEALEAFKLAAKHYQGEVTFGLIQDAKVAKLFKLKSEGEIAMLKPGERQVHSPSGFTSREDLVDWIQQNRKPLWGVLNFQNIYSVWQGIKTTFVVFLKHMEDHQSKTILSVFKTLAKQYGPTNDIAFVIVDAGVYKEFVQGVGLSEDDLPTFAIFNPTKRKEHFYPKDKQQLNIKNAKRWVDSFLAGKLETNEKTFYSESDPIIKIDSSNFEEIVLDKEKDVLVEFYAPWCDHCAIVAPQYKVVASYFKIFPSIVLAAFDTQASQVPKEYNITALPSFLFFPANNKETPIALNQAFDRHSAIQFILEYQSTLSEDSKEQFLQLLPSLETRNEESEEPEVFTFPDTEEE